MRQEDYSMMLQLLDRIAQAQDYTNQLLEHLVESAPSVGVSPANANTKAVEDMLRPILESPMLAGTPFAESILESVRAMGIDNPSDADSGHKDEH